MVLLLHANSFLYGIGITILACAVAQGYFVQYGGQFESQEKASRQILLFSIVAIAGIFLLLYIALKSVRSAFLVMANLPLALIGGVVMVFLSGGTLSIASLDKRRHRGNSNRATRRKEQALSRRRRG